MSTLRQLVERVLAPVSPAPPLPSGPAGPLLDAAQLGREIEAQALTAKVSTALDVMAIALPASIRHVASRASAAIAELDARIKLLEAEPFTYAGTHEQGKSYPKNSVVTLSGSLWIARGPTSQRPGADGPDWQLCVKAGRDASR